MMWLLASLGLLVVGGFGALALGRCGRNASTWAAGSIVAAAVLGCVPSLQVLAGHTVPSLRLPWPVPYGELFLELDPLSAWFLLPLLGLAALGAVYGVGYWGTGVPARRLGSGWFFYCLLVFAMALLFLARNAILFLFAWELMALASFFLVVFDDADAAARRAGWLYLVMSHLGTGLILALFLVLGNEANSMDFTHWAWRGVASPKLAGVLFALAVVGFGVKAGFVPVHIWLPEAHPAAPSHVSALMSGVMIKTGIYGLVRALTFLGAPQAWWGWVLIGVGISSGVLGVLLALAQHDLKRLLAYHSVENIGIITLGLGVGLVGVAANAPLVALLGLGGGLLHVLNHAVFKGLLFLGAGSVLHGTGTREMDHLGGLLKRMPWTGTAFLVGAVAIAGLPPLNGFVSELLIFAGGYHGVASSSAALGLCGLVALAGLALISGLAAACFAKAFGVVFLGEPRTSHAAHAHEAGRAMRAPMLLLAAACGGIALFAPVVLAGLGSVVTQLARLPQASVADSFAPVIRAITLVVRVTLLLAAFVAVLVALRRWLLAGRQVGAAGTWDCGYAQPTARMQYTASSFAQPLTRQFEALLRTRTEGRPVEGLLPREASFHTATPDVWKEAIYRPAMDVLSRAVSKVRWVQQGKVQLYVLYIALTLLALLLWKLR